MICPFCAHKKTRITNSRYVKTHYKTWRRHSCPACNKLFTTHELIDLSDITVVSQPKSRSSFTASRLLISLYACLEHLKEERATIADALCHTVITKMMPLIQGESEITTKTIADTAYATLKSYDRLASVQYAARHSTHLHKNLR